MYTNAREACLNLDLYDGWHIRFEINPDLGSQIQSSGGFLDLYQKW